MKTIFKLVFISIAILIFATAPCWSQSRVPPATDQSAAPPVPPPIPRTYSIRGTLRKSDTNGPADLVRLELTFSNGTNAASATTLANGEFEFQGIRNGVYNLTAEVYGYLPVNERVEVRNLSKEGLIIYVRKTAQPDDELSPTISAHFLALPHKAQDAYQKGIRLLYEKKDLKKSL